MKKILLLSESDDLHADAVAWGLRQLDCDPVLWQWSQFPRTDRYALELGPDRAAAFSIQSGTRQLASPFDVVWMRRPGTPRARATSHPDDRGIIHAEAQAFLKNMLDFVAQPDAMWVNPPDAIRRANHKLLQLMLAKAEGFLIPDSLVGNDVDQVRKFFDKHDGRIIFKAFLPGTWHDDAGNSRHLRTAALSAAHLARDEAILGCPGIFQQQVDTDYEIRVTVMGQQVLAGAIYSQAAGPSVDWRFTGPQDQIPLKALVLPADVAQRCIAVCRALGIVFGCIDLIVTRTGQVVFLEVNEAGQFLWQETIDSTMPVLDTFCRFLAGTPGHGTTSGDHLSLAKYLQSESFAQFDAAVRAARAESRE